MSDPQHPQIVTLQGLDCRFTPAAWSFVDAEEAAIAQNWARFIAERPESYNGNVFIQHRWRIEDGIYHADYLEADYASFIAWRDFGHPGPPMRNGFAMAALKSRDGAFLLGKMSEHTANPGKVFFAAGTPDRQDLMPDGRIDLAGSVLRELTEETGLQPHEVRIGDGWQAVIHHPRVAFMRPVLIDLDAKEARALMRSRLKALPGRELSDILIVRGRGDIDPVHMPPFQVAYLRAAFGLPAY